MYRLIWLTAIALAGCGTENDQRPRTVEYITQAILAPSCGNAQCHSSLFEASGYVFDTVEDAQQGLAGGLVGVIGLDDRNEPFGEPDESQPGTMMNVLTRTIDRMPWDQPLADADIDLIRRWIEFGAPGAQCNPSSGDTVCVGKKVVECRPSFDYGAVIQDCGVTGQNCAAGACR